MRSPAWTTTLSPTTLRPELVQDGGEAGAVSVGGAAVCQAKAGGGPSGVRTLCEGVGSVPVRAPSVSRTSARQRSGGQRRGARGRGAEGVGRDGEMGRIRRSRFA